MERSHVLVLEDFILLRCQHYLIWCIDLILSTLSVFYRNGKADPEIHMGLQGALNSENNLEKEQSWRTHISQFENWLQR